MRDFHLPGRSDVFASNGMVATSHPLAAKVGVEILEAGGNAVDAAIATALLLGICEPQMTGIGGDLFALIGRPGEQVRALNASGRAPGGLSAAEMRARGLDQVPLREIESVTLPGAVDGFCRLSEEMGVLGLDRVLAPAIRYAEEGVPVAPRVAFDWLGDEPFLKGAARQFYLNAGRAPRVGEMFRAPGQAEVLRRIARDGRKGFYEGEVADDMVASLRAMGGCHTLDDLAAVSCDWGMPVMGAFGGLEVLEHPPNGQGATAILMLNMLKHFDLAGMDPFGAARAHVEAEATKLAHEARDRIIADPDRTARLEFMLSEETATRLAGMIDPGRAQPVTAARVGAMHRDTVYLCVVDRDRMAVSLIYSVFWAFGSGLASERFGINFQNRGAGFVLEEGHPNEAAGGRRPMHTIIPGMLTDGAELVGPFGVMGGGYQPTGHARFVSNITTYGMGWQDAVDAPRSFWRAGKLEVERGYPEAVKAELAALGHDVVVPEEPLGGAQAIAVGADGVLRGASDPRKDGIALGY
jgi:gamma-glutamyltranspeptidase / glutathione hydrolase